MKIKLLLTVFVSSFFIHHSGLGQGVLTPPGAPAPTMKSLAQIEPRTPISSAPYAITNPGSYYLTTNVSVGDGSVTNAISITASGVTLDLSGFTINSTAPSATSTGILLGSALTDITILNGHIKGGVTYSGGVYSGSGFANGILESGSPPLNVRVTGVSVSGCMDNGIALGSINSTIVESCTVLAVGGYGIVASSVVRSTAKLCGNTAISADTASECNGNCTGSGNGVDASYSASGCTGSSTDGFGVNALAANSCYGFSFSQPGLSAKIAQNCYGQSINGFGLYATVAIGCYGDSASWTGLVATIANSCADTSEFIIHKYNMP